MKTIISADRDYESAEWIKKYLEQSSFLCRKSQFGLGRGSEVRKKPDLVILRVEARRGPRTFHHFHDELMTLWHLW